MATRKSLDHAGYGTMASEADEQLRIQLTPTHIFHPGGGVEFPGRSGTGVFHNCYPDNPPVVVVMEADSAACLYKGAKAADGNIRIVDGDMPTIMAGLACESQTPSGYPENHVSVFTLAPDGYLPEHAHASSSRKRRPTGDSGESGAVGMGL